MTEAELTDPNLRIKRNRYDIAKLILSSIAAVAASAALVVSLLLVVQVGTVTGTISDCTTPTGKCYQQGQQRNAENRAGLVDASVAANYCAQHASSLDAMQACVTRTMQLLGDR